MLGHRVADVAGHRLAGAVHSALLDPARSPRPRSGRVIRHGCGLSDRVCLNGEDTGPRSERMLDHRLLRGVVQAADVQNRGLHVGAVAGLMATRTTSRATGASARSPSPQRPGCPAKPLRVGNASCGDLQRTGPVDAPAAPASAQEAPARSLRKRRRRRALTTTETLEKAIAAPAMTGFRSPSAASGSAAML